MEDHEGPLRHRMDVQDDLLRAIDGRLVDLTRVLGKLRDRLPPPASGARAAAVAKARSMGSIDQVARALAGVESDRDRNARLATEADDVSRAAMRAGYREKYKEELITAGTDRIVRAQDVLKGRVTVGPGDVEELALQAEGEFGDGEDYDDGGWEDETREPTDSEIEDMEIQAHIDRFDEEPDDIEEMESIKSAEEYFDDEPDEEPTDAGLDDEALERAIGREGSPEDQAWKRYVAARPDEDPARERNVAPEPDEDPMTAVELEKVIKTTLLEEENKVMAYVEARLRLPGGVEFGKRVYQLLNKVAEGRK